MDIYYTREEDKRKVLKNIKQDLNGDLYPCEQKFIEEFFSGKHTFSFGKEDIFRLDVLKFIIFESAYKKYISPTGVCITGGILTGTNSNGENYLMDFSSNQFNRQLKIIGSTIAVGLDLSYCTLKSLILESCTLRFIKLSGSTIKGNLYFRECSFFGPANVFSVDAENMIVKGSICFTSSTFLSGVYLRGARIGANADFSRALCVSPEVSAIIGVGAGLIETIGNVEQLMKLSRETFHEFELSAESLERLDNISKRLREKINSGNKCRIPENSSSRQLPHSKHQYAVCLQKTFVGGSVIFGVGSYDPQGFLGVGQVTLNSCRTDGSVLCSGCCFFQPGVGVSGHTVALCLDAVDARLSIFLDDGFFAHGTVSLRGARTQQRLVCTKAIFVKAITKIPANEERDDYALFAKRISVQGDVVIHGKEASDSAVWGRISFENGTIGGSLHLCAQEAKPQSTIFRSKINLQFSRIKNNLMLILKSPDDQCKKEPPAKVRNIKINKERKINQTIDLSFADIGILSINVNCVLSTDWKLDGINYLGINFGGHENDKLMNFDKWLSMLSSQNAIQPYKPFIAYLKAADLEHHVNQASYCKEDHVVSLLRKSFKSNNSMSMIDKWCTFVELLIRWWIIRLVVGYGYKWGRGIVCLLLLILISTAVFYFAEKEPVFASRAYIYTGIFPLTGSGSFSDNSANKIVYPHFNALVFSIDAAIPGLDLGQERHWEVKGNLWLECYLYIHVVLGWIISFLLVLSPTQLLHRE